MSSENSKWKGIFVQGNINNKNQGFSTQTPGKSFSGQHTVFQKKPASGVLLTSLHFSVWWKLCPGLATVQAQPGGHGIMGDGFGIRRIWLKSQFHTNYMCSFMNPYLGPPLLTSKLSSCSLLWGLRCRKCMKCPARCLTSLSSSRGNHSLPFTALVLSRSVARGNCTGNVLHSSNYSFGSQLRSYFLWETFLDLPSWIRSPCPSTCALHLLTCHTVLKLPGNSALTLWDSPEYREGGKYISLACCCFPTIQQTAAARYSTGALLIWERDTWIDGRLVGVFRHVLWYCLQA